MRLLIFGINFPPELISTGRYTGDLAQYLVKNGWQVRVVTAPPYYPHWKIQPGYIAWKYQRESWAGMQVYRCPLWVPKAPSNLKRILHLLSFALSSLPVMLAQAAWKPDVVLCVIPTLFNAPAALLAARLGSAKSWLHIQDFELDAAFNLGMLPGRKLLYKMAQAFERFIFARFDRLSTISGNMLALAVEKGVPQDRIMLVPNWVDIRKIFPVNGKNPLRTELRIPKEKRVVLYHGNLGRKQGLEVLIDIAAYLQNEKDILVLLCGEGPARVELEERARGLTNVRFAGLQPEVKLNQLVNLADVHVLPQRAGVADLVMPSKLTTMLASGKPVVACAAPGTQLWEVIRQVGITVKPEDAHALAEAISKLANDPMEGARLGQLGREYVCQHLDKEVILAQIKDAILELSQGDKPPYKSQERPV